MNNGVTKFSISKNIFLLGLLHRTYDILVILNVTGLCILYCYGFDFSQLNQTTDSLK